MAVGDIICLIFSLYMLSVFFGWTCLLHDWQDHGPTRHMIYDKKIGRKIFWSRYWRVCSRCGAKRRGRKVE